MFGFGSKKTLAQSGILNGFSDFHSHILPGVDDGIQSVEEALETLEAYEAFGIKKVVFTPHVMEEYPDNRTAYLRAQFSEFRKLYSGNIEISLGAEYMMDYRFGELLETETLLTVANDYLLIETTSFSAPLRFTERLKEIQAKGYFIVLAHPERYGYMQKEDYKELRAMGVLFQLNLLSLIGGYGQTVEKKAKELLHSGLYDIIGTDIHSKNYHTRQITQKEIGKKELAALLRIRDNPPF